MFPNIVKRSQDILDVPKYFLLSQCLWKINFKKIDKIKLYKWQKGFGPAKLSLYSKINSRTLFKAVVKCTMTRP